jgi:hypothetical protein
MTPDELARAWVRQAQLDAERGVIVCRMCIRHASLETTLTLWRDGVLVFAVCDGCAGSHEVVMRPTAEGIEVRARHRAPLIVGAPR